MSVVVCGHFGEFIQGLLPDGRLGLLSVPCSEYRLELCNQAGAIREDIREILDDFEAQNTQNNDGWDVTTNMIAGGGAGYSTALRMGLAKAALGINEAQALIGFIQKSERAIDPLMFENFEQLLWASRDQIVLSRMPPLPKMRICGGFVGAPQKTDAQDIHFPEIDDLVAAWKTAKALEEFAEISMQSARRCLQYRGGDDGGIFDLAQKHQALGVVIAHTGSLRGLIYEHEGMMDTAIEEMRLLGFENVVDFELGGAG